MEEGTPIQVNMPNMIGKFSTSKVTFHFQAIHVSLRTIVLVSNENTQHMIQI